MTEIIEIPLDSEIEKARKEYAANTYQREIDAVNEQRRQAYQLESDPIFFQWQRGDTYTEQDWKNKIAEIDERYPYPVKEGK